MSNKTFMGFSRGKALFLSEDMEEGISIIYENEELPPWQFILSVVIISILVGFSTPFLIKTGIELVPKTVTEIGKILEVRHD